MLRVKMGGRVEKNTDKNIWLPCLRSCDWQWQHQQLDQNQIWRSTHQEEVLPDKDDKFGVTFNIYKSFHLPILFQNKYEI